MARQHYLALDLGASGGRAVMGLFDGKRLQLEEIHRFSNGIVRLHNRLHWDVLRLYGEILEGLRLCARGNKKPLSVGVDTWGVDFALIGKNGTLLGNPYAYRDPHTEGMMDWAFTQASREMIFEQTGIQFMPINTLYHLIALVHAGSPLLKMAERFLMIPDLFHFFLTGEQAVEFTNATTTQCYNPRTGAWAWPLLDTLDIPTHFLSDIVPPGTRLGPLLPAVAEDTGLGGVTVVAPATHDTGSAVAAVPAQGEDWAYLSSGTWSLMGIESPVPIISKEALAFNVTNEGGVGGTFRILKNIAGLWLIQECRRIWAREGEPLDYDDIVRLAESAPPFAAFIDPDDPAFLNPLLMPDAVREACARTGQAIPVNKGQIARCIFESLALKYRYVLDQLAALRGKPVSTLHIVGGGTQNKLLCQLTANATGMPAVAGPVEATAIGNILVQAMAQGAVTGLAQIREVVRSSFPLETYTPQDTGAWEDAYARFKALYG
jgi:rhamnulokinase